MVRMLRFTLGLGLALVAGCTREPAPPPIAPTPAPAPMPVASAAAPAPTPAAQSPLALVLDSSGTHFSGEPTVIVPPPDDPALGADAKLKRSGPNDLYLVPLAAALEREKAAGRLRLPLRVLVSRVTSYRVLIEVLFTAGQTEIGEFELCEESCGARSFHFALPRMPGRPATPSQHQTLDLAALIVKSGISIKGSGGNIAPGCAGVGTGIAVARRGANLDLAAFEACIAKIRASSPDWAGEDSARISANPDTPFHEVMDVALALRSQRFSKLMLAVPR